MASTGGKPLLMSGCLRPASGGCEGRCSVSVSWGSSRVCFLSGSLIILMFGITTTRGNMAEGFSCHGVLSRSPPGLQMGHHGRPVLLSGVGPSFCILLLFLALVPQNEDKKDVFFKNSGQPLVCSGALAKGLLNMWIKQLLCSN